MRTGLRGRKTSARATIVWIPGQVLLINLLIRFELPCPSNRNGNYARVVSRAAVPNFEIDPGTRRRMRAREFHYSANTLPKRKTIVQSPEVNFQTANNVISAFLRLDCINFL